MASGGAFTKFSHEFQTLTDAGEDVIYLHRGKKIAINKEVLLPEVLEELGVKEAELEEVKAAEVGNIFSFGGSKSEQLGLRFNDEKGEAHPVILGSYGIGITRLMGTVVEIFADDKGIVWPESIAPFKYHLIDLNSKERANKIYKALADKGIEVLFDDRDTRAGEKFADADLIGIPYQVIVSERGEAEKTVEVKNRMTGETKIISEEEFVSS